MNIRISLLFTTTFFLIAFPFIAKGAVVINEVLYDPEGTDTGLEYIKLYNNSDSAVDLTGWDLDPADAKYFTFPAFTLNAKSFVTIHINASGTNTNTDLYDSGSSNMSNTKGPIALFNNTTHSVDTIVDYIEYGAGGQTNESKAVSAGIWTAGDFIPDVAEGKAIRLKTDGADNNSPNDWMEAEPSITQGEPESTTEKPTTPTLPTGNQPPIANAGNNIIAFIDEEITFDGSKSYDPDGLDLAYEWNLGEGGVKNDIIVTHKYSYPGTYLVTLMVFDGRYYTKDTITVEIYPKKITINEFLSSPVGKDEEEEWIELYNDSDQIVDISGWQLDDEDGGSKLFTFPENTLIAPKNYLVFSRQTTGIALNNDSDKVRLLLSTGVVFQEISYEKAPEGQSSARTPQGFVWSIPTPGLPNIIGLSTNQDTNANKPLETFNAGDSSENMVLYYEDNPKNSIKGGWTQLSQSETGKDDTGQYYNLANLSESTGSNNKLILIILTVVVVVFAVGILKLKKKY